MQTTCFQDFAAKSCEWKTLHIKSNTNSPVWKTLTQNTGGGVQAERAARRPRVPIATENRLAPVVASVLILEALPLLRQVIAREDRRHRTHRNARAAVDALHRINEQLIHGVRTSLIRLRMNAVHRAGVHTRPVLGSNARFRNYIRHNVNLLKSSGCLILLGVTQILPTKFPHFAVASYFISAANLRAANSAGVGIGDRFFPANISTNSSCISAWISPFVASTSREASVNLLPSQWVTLPPASSTIR